MKNETVLTLAIQKSGRLSEKTNALLKEAGIKLENGSKRKLKSKAVNFPLEIIYLRDDDIPNCVEEGIADAGVAGENVFLENESNLTLAEKLGFGKCRLSIAVPKSFNYQSISDCQGLNFATSYPVILRKYLNDNGVDAAIHKFSGSVEITPSVGMADAICDIVSTGSTLVSNGLVEVEKILESEAVLMRNTDLSIEKLAILERLLFRIRSVNRARNTKYILLNCPNDAVDSICRILPGMKSPTVTPLADKGWSSLQSVIQEDDFWDIIESLKTAGAEGILVIPIEKMIG